MKILISSPSQDDSASHKRHRHWLQEVFSHDHEGNDRGYNPHVRMPERGEAHLSLLHLPVCRGGPVSGATRGAIHHMGIFAKDVMVPEIDLQSDAPIIFQSTPMTPESPRYECEPGCGACCKGHLIVECDDIDVLREPRLIESDPYYNGKTAEEAIHEIQTEWKAVIIACSRPCTFLTDNKCSIYPTRPNACVGMEAGDEQCQAAREREGLPPLLPIK